MTAEVNDALEWKGMMAEKWNGKSVYQLNQKKERINNLDAAIGELSRLRHEAESAYLEELGRIIERDPGSIRVGNWECEKSPNKRCIYNMAIAEYDECLFCGGPAERK